MSKFRSLILIIGLLLIAVAAALLTVLVLYATGTIVTDPIELVYEVGSDTKYYDGTPLTLADDDYALISGELLEGHTAQVKVIGSQTNAGESETTLEVKFFDKKGFDVSDEYAVKVNTGKLTVEKQNLSVVIPNSQVVYNGKEVFFNDYEIIKGSLARGHKIAGANASLLNVGKLPVDVQPIVYDAFDNDVTENYNIDFKAGDVEIIPRPLTIKPKDVSKVYDGTGLTATEYEIVSGSLASGQKIECTIVTTSDGEATFVDCTDDFGVRIKFGEFKIVDEDGNTVDLNNYDYERQSGILKIEKRPITFATANQTFTYDGEEHFNDTVQILSGSLAPNQLIAIANATKVTTVIENEPNIIDFSITSKDGTPVSTNYDITYINGKLSVTPFNLTVYTKSYTKVYDGNPLGDLINADGTNYELKVDLDSKFTIAYDLDAAVTGQVNAIAEKAYQLKNIAVSISGEEGDTPCTENFLITVRDGKYSVTKKSATVQSPSATFTYDGTEHYIDDESKCIAQGLITGHKLAMTDYTKVVYVSDSGLNVISYDIVSGTQTVTDNYDIKVSYGTLTVNKRALNIQSGSQSFEYDGNAHNYRQDYKTAGLITKDVFTITDSTTVKDVEGDVPNIFAYTITAGTADVSENYEITFTAGRLAVIQKAVTVTTQGETKVYDGTALTKEGGTPNGLLTGHTLELIGNAPSITDAGTLQNEQIFNIKDSAGAYVTRNYNVSYVYGTLTVTPKPVTVSLNALTSVYNGEAYEITPAEAFDNAELLGYGLTEGDFALTCFAEMKNVNTYYYSADFTGKSQNYTVTAGMGTVKITPKEVQLISDIYEVDMNYRGFESYYGDDAYLIANLKVDGHDVKTAVFNKTLTEITVASVTVYGEDGDLTANYNIAYNVTITVNIAACAISLVLPEYTNDYYVDSMVAAGVTAQGLAAGDELVVTADDIYSPGYSYYQVITFRVMHGGEDVTGYYTVTNLGAQGKVTITYPA